MNAQLNRLLIPAGRPPAQLTWPSLPPHEVETEVVEQESAPATQPSLEASLVEAMENSTGSVLMDSSEALSTSVGKGRSPAPRHTVVAVSGEDTGDLPTDEALKQWALACREKMRAQNYYLTREGLQYWLRYFFDASKDAARWRYARERLTVLVRE